jgi:hypothetical protein
MPVLGDVKTNVAIAVDSKAITLIESANIDTQGYNRMLLVFSRGGGSGTWISADIKECDTSGGTYVIVPNGDPNTDCVDVEGTSVTVASATDQDGTLAYDIDLSYRKRFIKFEGYNGFGATTQQAVVCFLFEPSNIYTDTESDYALSDNDPGKGARYARI